MMKAPILLEENLKLRSAYRKELHRLLISGVKDFGTANKIKNELLKNESNLSKKFYRYRSFWDWEDLRLNSEIEDIKNGRCNLIDVSKFNDPYDCRIPLQPLMDHSQSDVFLIGLRNLLDQRCDDISINPELLPLQKELAIRKEKAGYENCLSELKTKKGLLKESKEIREKNRAACFATRPNDMYFWSHYGGVHKGYCLEYEFEDDAFGFMHPVEYVENWPDDFYWKSPASALIKSTDWLKESEWRIIAFGNVIKEISNLKISAIYLGLDFFKLPDTEPKREKLLKGLNVENIFQAQLKSDGFGIIFQEITRAYSEYK